MKEKFDWKFSAIAFILFVAIGFGVYFYYWIERPTYAAEQICIAVKGGNAALFEKYVDLQSVYGNAYDQYSEILVEEQSKKIKDPKWLSRKLSGKMAISVLRTFKPEVVDTLKNLTLKNIENRNKKNDKDIERTESKHGISNLFVKLLETIAEENDLKDLDVIDFDIEKISDNSAEGYVNFKNRVKEVQFTIKFRMERVTGSNWKVVKITNLTEILNRIKKNPINVENLL